MVLSEENALSRERELCFGFNSLSWRCFEIQYVCKNIKTLSGEIWGSASQFHHIVSLQNMGCFYPAVFLSSVRERVSSRVEIERDQRLLRTWKLGEKCVIPLIISWLGVV